MELLLDRYEADGFFDEYAQASGEPRSHYAALARNLSGIAGAEFAARVQSANATMLQRGVTFTVYNDAAGTERILPFDLIPRIVPAAEWDHIERGITQRVRALNHFLDDVYHDQRILRKRVVPLDLVYSCKHFCREMVGVAVRGQVYVHVGGLDLIRSGDGTYFVLEDNLRTPSGISYVLENRDILKRIFPSIFDSYRVRPVDLYPLRLLAKLRASAPRGVINPYIVVLTPGIFNSAYFEHSLLANRMGIELVEGRDLIVHDNVVYVKTTKGLQRIDVIYRRIDDDFLDPLYFRPDSALGVPGLMNAYRAGNVVLANAIGNGVADDKSVYRFVPAMIKYYLGEDPILPNVETYDCNDPLERQHVVSNLENLVVKRTSESGGYGMLIGPASTAAQREEFAVQINANPRDYIAQPVIPLSCHPTAIDGALRPRHIDLRVFALSDAEGVEVTPAGLTRVALREGSLVVNSSQGGGSKDTWVLRD